MRYGVPAHAPPVQAYQPPAYQAPAPATANAAGQDEIRRLQERVEELENRLAATRSRQQTYNVPESILPPAAAPVMASPGGYGTAASQPPLPGPGTGQSARPQQAPAREWLPSGYQHPAMLQ